MSKLDLVLERIRQLPPERQEMIAVEDLLTAEQRAEMDLRIAGPDDSASKAETGACFKQHGA